MARFHLRFRNFDQPVLDATDALFTAKPWRDEQTAQEAGQTWLDAMTEHYGISALRLVIGRDTFFDHDDEDDGPYEDDDIPTVNTAAADDPLAYVPGSSLAAAPDAAEQIASAPPEADPEREARRQRRAELAARGTLVLDKWSLIQLFKAFRKYMISQRVALSTQRRINDDLFGWACSLFYIVRPVMFRARVREGRIRRITPDELLSSETLARRRQESIDAQSAAVRDEINASESATFEDIPEGDVQVTPVEEAPSADAAVTPITIEPEEPIVTPEFTAMAVRLEAHNMNAGEDVQGMTTRPLRRYVTTIGMSGAWDMSKDQIIDRLKQDDDLAAKAVAASRSARSEVGTGEVQ